MVLFIYLTAELNESVHRFRGRRRPEKSTIQSRWHQYRQYSRLSLTGRFPVHHIQILHTNKKCIGSNRMPLRAPILNLPILLKKLRNKRVMKFSNQEVPAGMISTTVILNWRSFPARGGFSSTVMVSSVILENRRYP
jgi:hypothetical protein